MSSTKHQQFLNSHCRVCGKTFGKKTRYTCSKYLTILEGLGIDPANDNDDIHPGSFCNSCYLTAKRLPHSSSKIRPVRAHVEWLAHSDSYCQICDGQCKGGRPKKSSSGGRPSLLTTHINFVACKLPAFSLSQIVDET